MLSAKYYSDGTRARLNVYALTRLLWIHIPARRRSQALVLLALMVVSAAMEVISLGAILPFVAILTNPEPVFFHAFVQRFAHELAIESPQQLILPLALLFGVTALTAGLLRLLVLWANNRLSSAIGADISSEVFRRTLNQPYRVHLGRNSSLVLSGITLKAGAVSSVTLSILTLMSSLVLVASIMITLMMVDAGIAMAAAFCFGGAYAVISYVVRGRLLKNSECVAKEHTKVIKVVQEGLGGIRDVLLTCSQPVYCEQYCRADRLMRYAQASTMFMGGAPRLVLEAIGMALLALIAYLISRNSGGVAAALPMLGAIALGAQRMLPALQQTYSAWAGITGNQVPVLEAFDLLDQPVANYASLTSTSLSFNHEIRFESVRFRYEEGGPWVLDGCSLVVKKGDRVGIIGETGSGKSTLLDILMGLLEPIEGLVLVDNVPVHGGNRPAWQKFLAHVPQSIYLSDASIAENIAFGVPRDSINHERVKHAAREAMLSPFIDGLPASYETIVGERGIRLSGGEKQRIGIARAVYKNAPILILDEATSALDNLTEQNVMSVVADLSHETTVFIVAHRLTTVRGCNRIFELRDGRTITYDSYEEMTNNYAAFNALKTETTVKKSLL